MSLVDFQMSLGRHVRDPRRAVAPEGVSRRRLAVYDELVFNNLQGLLEPCFPVIRSVLGRRWTRLVRQFCREARCHTPLFREVPGEFLQWLLNADTCVSLPPWARELAHYEWAELAVDTMAVEVTPSEGALDLPPAHLLASAVRVNPSLLNLHYQWPVQRIGPAHRPRKPQATSVLIYRDRHDEVRFMAVEPASARLLHLLSAGGTTLAQAADAVALELGRTSPAALHAAALDQCRQWLASDVILGVST
ncbi:MAG: DUF2063 domain-containing protein [Rubrivivax sp.]|nr:MAG: DUF2063 domain-containing protein [Rubrivivax sp.]